MLKFKVLETTEGTPLLYIAKRVPGFHPRTQCCKQCSLRLTNRFCWTTEPGWTMGYNLDGVHPWCWSTYTTRVAKEHGGVWSNRWQGVLPKWTLPEGQYLNLPYDVWEVLAEAIVEQGGVSVAPKPGNADFLEHWGALPARLVCSGLYKAMHKLLFQKHTAWVANEVAWHKISKVPHMRCHPRPGALKRRDWWIMEKQVASLHHQVETEGEVA